MIFITFIIGFSFQESTKSIVITEGFYSSSWESSIFYEIRGNKVYKPEWLVFNNQCKFSESLGKIFDEREAMENFYIKIKAIKREGSDYGHLASYKKEFEVLKIIKVDTTYSINDFLRE